MDEVIGFRTDSGGLLLLDPASSGFLGDEVGDLLGIVLDPEGRTAQDVGDDEPWTVTWERAAHPLELLQKEGRIQIILTGEGVFHIRVTDARGRFGSNVRASWFCGRLLVNTGRLTIADMWPNPASSHTLALSPGEYWLWVHALEGASDVPRTVGVVGTVDWPALALELCSDPPAEVLPAPFPHRIPFPEAAWQPEAGCLCEATVKRSEGAVLLLNLHRTRRIMSGYARMPTPSSSPPHVGQSILVRVLSRASGYWNVEWIKDR